jgi:RNA polymerase-binding transcription factor DksA
MDFAFCRWLKEGLDQDKIACALMKIEDESYGRCEMCEEDISIKRLTATIIPESCTRGRLSSARHLRA